MSGLFHFLRPLHFGGCSRLLSGIQFPKTGISYSGKSAMSRTNKEKAMTNGGGHPPNDPNQSAAPADKPKPTESKDSVKK